MQLTAIGFNPGGRPVSMPAAVCAVYRMDPAKLWWRIGFMRDDGSLCVEWYLDAATPPEDLWAHIATCKEDSERKLRWMLQYQSGPAWMN